MLILITAVPGSGKSLFAVEMLHKYLGENETLIKEGKQPRPIYSDIDGLSIDGVLPAPDDWRTCPDGSIVFYDECQQRFGPDGQGRSSRGDIQELETHRHRGFDIVLITQHPKLLHAHIRRLIGKHYHLLRLFGTQQAKVFARDGQIDVDKPAQLKDQDAFLWQFPRQLFGVYKSATLHTHKRHVPAWLKRMGYVVVFFLAVFAFTLSKSWGFFTGKESIDHQALKPAQNAAIQSQSALSSVGAVPVPVAFNCISSASHCACYSKQGQNLNLPDSVCRATMAKPYQFIPSRPDSTPPPPAGAAATPGGVA